MSVCAQSGPTEDDSASEEAGAASGTRDTGKQKPTSKVVRVLTVLAYLLSVSLAAILLSVYYVCVWKSPELPPELGEPSAAARTHYRHGHAHHSAHISVVTGGGDTPVTDDIVYLPPENITSDFTEDSVPESTTGSTLNATAPPDFTLGLHNGSTEVDSLDSTDSIT